MDCYKEETSVFDITVDLIMKIKFLQCAYRRWNLLNFVREKTLLNNLQKKTKKSI